MAIPTTRTKQKAEIRIHTEKCNGCGLCVSVCKDNSLVMHEGKVSTTANPFFGCIGCGHCMAICPVDAITIHGRELSPDDLFDISSKDMPADYSQVLDLLNRRRSIREFKNTPVDPETITKILDAAQTAPMGLPPSDVHVLVFDKQQKVRRFAEEYCNYLEKMRWFFSPWFLKLMRSIWGKANDELFRGFLKPLFHVYTDHMKKGENLVTYDAPLAMYFYGTAYCDPADPVVAATYAMVAGESLGLGTCMLGGIHPLIQNGRYARKFREQQGIKYKSREGLFVIFGHPRVHYKKGIHRTFASVSFRN